MPRRHILTERQRKALFDLPTDEGALLRHYILDDDDIEHIRTRRHAHNKLGFALQLCAFRYPGRLLTAGEVIPLPLTGGMDVINACRSARIQVIGLYQ
jgi:TnpA family transposase